MPAPPYPPSNGHPLVKVLPLKLGAKTWMSHAHRASLRHHKFPMPAPLQAAPGAVIVEYPEPLLCEYT